MALFGKSTNKLEPSPETEGQTIHAIREEVVMIHHPTSQVAEQFRRLRNSLQALNPDGAARSILLSSAVQGEGKTVATLNLGLAFAEVPGLRVLVLDGDMQNPSIEYYLGMQRRQGLAEVLLGSLPMDQAIRPTGVERMHVVGAGMPPQNIGEVLNLDRLRAVLNSLKRRYDYVLIDSPSALTVNHASLIGSVADGILLVVRIGKTSRYQVEEAFNLVENVGGNVLGTCLTGTNEPDQSAGR